MEFEWDEYKNQSNVSKHGIDFNDAKKVFDDLKRIKSPDLRKEYNEERWITIGKIQNIIIVVVYTLRNTKFRIISARYAKKSEREQYNNENR
jgi:uncharacterized protein